MTCSFQIIAQTEAKAPLKISPWIVLQPQLCWCLLLHGGNVVFQLQQSAFCNISKVLAVISYFLPLFAGFVSLQSRASKNIPRSQRLSWTSMKDLQENWAESDCRRQHLFFWWMFKSLVDGHYVWWQSSWSLVWGNGGSCALSVATTFKVTMKTLNTCQKSKHAKELQFRKSLKLRCWANTVLICSVFGAAEKYFKSGFGGLLINITSTSQSILCVKTDWSWYYLLIRPACFCQTKLA